MTAELHRFVAELRFRDQFLMTADGIDTRDENSELLLSLRAAMDALQGRRTGYRIFRSLREVHKEKHSVGGRCYGYTSVADGDDYRRRVVDPGQAPIVKEIFDRFAAGESAKSIVRDFNSRGIASPGASWKVSVRRAAGWCATTLTGCHTKASGILRNPVYKGESTWNRVHGRKKPGTGRRVQRRRPTEEWIITQDERLRIVSDEVWARVQRRLEAARRAASVKGGRPNRYLLSGVLRCSSCSGSYTVRNAHNMQCSSHSNGRTSLCSQRRPINRKRAEERLLTGVRAMLLDPAFLRDLQRRVQSRLRDRRRPDRRKQQDELARIEKELGHVVDGVTRLGGSVALLARLRELEASKARVVDAMAADARPVEIVPDVEKLIRERIRTLEKIPSHRLADDGLRETARSAVRGLLGGDVPLVEEADGVYAVVDLGRVCITHGAGGGT